MKLSKKQLKRIIREEKRKITKSLRESSGIDDYEKLVGSRRSQKSGAYPRPQHPMIANAGAETDSARVDSIADELALEGMSEDKAIEVAKMILNRLKQDGLI